VLQKTRRVGRPNPVFLRPGVKVENARARGQQHRRVHERQERILGHSLPQDWVLESFSDPFSWNDSTECVDADGSLQDVVSLDVDRVDDISGSDDDASMGEVNSFDVDLSGTARDSHSSREKPPALNGGKFR